MIFDIPPLLQNTPSRPLYSVVEPYHQNSLFDCLSNSKSTCRQVPLDLGDFGGHFETVSGTSLSTTTYQSFSLVPWEKPIPYVVIQLDQLAQLLESKPELRPAKTPTYA